MDTIPDPAPLTSTTGIGRNRCDSLWFILAAILATGLLNHGLLLLTDYFLWDSWSNEFFLKHADQLVHLQRQFGEIGRPLDLFFIKPLALVDRPQIWAKWLGWSAWVATAFLVRRVMRRGFLLSPTESLLVAAIGLAMPLFSVLGELCLLMNTVAVLFFWIGWVLLLLLPGLTGWRALFIRLSALGIFFFSFNLNSQLVFFYALAVAILLMRWSRSPRTDPIAYARRQLRAFPDFALWPILFWIAKSLLTPTSGYYANYNHPSLDPALLVRGFGSIFQYLLPGELARAFESTRWVVMSALIVCLVATALIILRGLRKWQTELDVRGAILTIPLQAILRIHFLYRSSRLLNRPRWLRKWVNRPATQSSLLMALCGIGLFAAAALPYVMVDQQFAATGWLTRNAILFNYPAALILVGLCRFLQLALFPKWRPAILAPIAFIFLLCVGSNVRGYLTLQAFGAKQASIAASLRKVAKDTGAIVIQLRDHYQIPDTIYYYPPIVWTYMAAWEKAQPETLVIETAQTMPDQIFYDKLGQTRRAVPQIAITPFSLDRMLAQTTMPYALQGIPKTGPQASLEIMPGGYGHDGVQIGICYLMLKWLRPSMLPDFVRELTNPKSYILEPVSAAPKIVPEPAKR